MPLVDRIAALKIPVTFVCAYTCVHSLLTSLAQGQFQMVILTGWTLRVVHNR